MSDLLPIVPGCRALVIAGPDQGTEVLVGEKVDRFRFVDRDGDVTIFVAKPPHDRLWTTDKELCLGKYAADGAPVRAGLITEKWLMRIDGGEDLEDEFKRESGDHDHQGRPTLATTE